MNLEKLWMMMIATGMSTLWSQEFSCDNEFVKDGDKVVASMQNVLPKGLKLEREVAKVDAHLFKVTNIVRAEKDLVSVSFKFKLMTEEKPTYMLIPGVNYNGNAWGKGLEPKSFKEGDIPRSYEYSRVAIPGATYSEGGQYVVALWGVAPKSVEEGSFSCSLAPLEEGVEHNLIYPDEELPSVYSGKDQYAPGYKNTMNFKAGESREIVFYVYVHPREKELRATRGMYDLAWKVAEKPKLEGPSLQEVWDLGIDYVTKSLWAEEGSYKGFSIGMRPNKEGKFEQRPAWKYEIAWCGNNASLSVSLLEDYLKNKREDSLKKGLACLDTWTTDTFLPSGLFITHYDNILEKRENPVDACNLGAGALNLLLAADKCDAVGHSRPKVREGALRFCDFMVKDQQSSGQYGKIWSYDGTCLDREGSIGAFIIPAIVQAYNVTQDKKYLQSAQKAFAFYIKDLLQFGYATAGALDTWCIDCESAWPILRSAMMLYKATQDKQYLDFAETAAYYIASWQWHYPVPMPVDNDFTKYGYNTFGASSVSTQHHHISSHTICIADCWIELSKLTGNPMWKERAMAMWRNGTQLISDGTLVIHDKVRPRGSQNEAFFQCKWSFDTDPRKTINEWCVAWPSAFRLEVLRRMKDWKDMED